MNGRESPKREERRGEKRSLEKLFAERTSPRKKSLRGEGASIASPVTGYNLTYGRELHLLVFCFSFLRLFSTDYPIKYISISINY